MLKNGWDDILKDHENLILVLCGSVSAWIQENLLDSATFGGRFSRNIVLKELCEAGFVTKDVGINPATRRPTKLVRYRVSDNYTRFYLKYIEPHEAEIRRKLAVFPRKRNVSVRTALVYEGELDDSVAKSGVFDFIIPIEDLLVMG